MAFVSAIVCTRDRPQDLARAVQALLDPPTADIELIVIDQSDGPEAERILRERFPDPRLVYQRSTSRGKGAALNQGLRAARGEFVVCTDDDCEAPPDWIVGMGRVLEAAPAVAIAFCNVVAGPYDPSEGYIPVFVRDRKRVLTSIWDVREGLGLGAGMVVRRSVVLALGAFDEMLGPGSRFGSGDDWDISLRALIAGHQVLEIARLPVVHYGFRTFAQGRGHAMRDWIAIGALCAKPVHAGYVGALVLSVRLFWLHALWPPILDVLKLRRPSGAARITGFAKGFARGLATKLEPGTLRFRSNA